MTLLEGFALETSIRGTILNGIVIIVNIKCFGSNKIQINYQNSRRKLETQVLYRDNKPSLEKASKGRPWSFDGDGSVFRLVFEAQRIRLAHLFDPVLDFSPADIDNHAIGTVFEGLVRKYNDENNEEAIENWTLRDVVRLMVNFIFLLIEKDIKSGSDRTALHAARAGFLIKDLIARGAMRDAPRSNPLPPVRSFIHLAGRPGNAA